MRHAAAILFVAALATLTLGAGPAGAARVLYVTAHGVDTGACGAVAQPCRTIEHALTGAASGDRVVVGPGVYPSVLLTKAVSLESTHGAAATIIQGDPIGIFVVAGAEGAVIGKPSKGFTVRGAGVGISVVTADVTIEDNVVIGAFIGVFGHAVAPRLTLAGNVVSGGLTGILTGGSDVSIVQNVVHGDGTGTGLLIISTRGVVSNNVFTGHAKGVDVDTDLVTVRRNTFASNDVGLEINRFASRPIVTSNNFLGNDAGSRKCGLRSFISETVNAARNYWGSPDGPGIDPADRVCSGVVTTTPFLRAPASVISTGGR